MVALAAAWSSHTTPYVRRAQTYEGDKEADGGGAQKCDGIRL